MKLSPEEQLQAVCIAYARQFKDVVAVASLNGVSWGIYDKTKPWAKKAYKDKLTKLGALWGDPDIDLTFANGVRYKEELKDLGKSAANHQKVCMNTWMAIGVPCFVTDKFEVFKKRFDDARAGIAPAATVFDVDLGDPIPWE